MQISSKSRSVRLGKTSISAAHYQYMPDLVSVDGIGNGIATVYSMAKGGSWTVTIWSSGNSP